MKVMENWKCAILCHFVRAKKVNDKVYLDDGCGGFVATSFVFDVCKRKLEPSFSNPGQESCGNQYILK